MRLAAEQLTLGYADRDVVREVDVQIPDGRITVIIGPNGCGKSTLLRGLSRLLAPRGGAVLLDGKAIHTLRTKEVARELGMLPQSPVAPDGLSVFDLVSRGRSPHQSWWRQWDVSDEEAVHEALTATRMSEHAARAVDELSGGQRQRAWIAMALAQQTPLLLLDEPTTHLDIAHQIEVLDLVVDLNRADGRTVVMVVHELDNACRYADHLIAMKDGRIVAEGPPAELVTAELIETVFELRALVVPDPVGASPLVIPYGRHHGLTPSDGRH